MARKEIWIAIVNAPTPKRKHRKIVAEGRSEHEALVNLAAKIVALGNPPTKGEIHTVQNDSKF